jgi:hypothetical protein
MDSDRESVISGGADEACLTDNEEEQHHDHVECTECGEMTHISSKACGKCNKEFKISSTGYLQDDFVTDDIDDLSYTNDSDDEDDVVDDVYSDVSDDDDSEDDPSLDFLIDDEADFLPKRALEIVSDPKFERITRSRKKVKV